MGLVRKSSIESYWNNSDIVATPFFGQYMSRNTFQNILSNFQVVDNKDDIPRNRPGHDPLFKVRPFLDMMERTFKQSFKPGRDLSFDEGCVPFKGKVRFRCYNPAKPAKFHIKLFSVNDAKTGFCLGFDVYVGKGLTRCATQGTLLDDNCTQTTKVVFGLLSQCGLLDKGHRVYMDNYYTSCELFEELLYRYTFACGTVRPNRKGLPEAVVKAKLKSRDECVFRRNGSMLCFRWFDKKPVTMLTTIHEANMVETGKTDRLTGNKIEKPEAVYFYCGLMGGVDLNDQLLTYYNFLRRSLKWSRKLLIHCFNMIILNAHILHKLYGKENLSHDAFRDRIVKHLLKKGLENYSIALPAVMSKKLGKCNTEEHDEKRLSERHFPSHIPAAAGRVRQRPSRVCIVCNNLPNAEVNLSKKKSSFWCGECRKVMCVYPCFELYHTQINYKRDAFDYRVGTLAFAMPISPE